MRAIVERPRLFAIVGRGIGERNATVMARFPDHRPYRLRWKPVRGPVTIEPVDH